MIHFMRKPAAGSQRTVALLAAVIGPAAGVALWGAAMAAQAGDPPSQPPAPDAHSSAPPASATKPAAKSDSDDRVICHEEEAPTGSRLGARRVCHTQREWRQIAQDNKDWLDTVSRTPPNPGR